MIAVLGTDHQHAPLEVRSAFSFTKKDMRIFLNKLVKAKEDHCGSAGRGGTEDRHEHRENENPYAIDGAVILSTCNRMELWVSCHEKALSEKEAGAGLANGENEDLRKFLLASLCDFAGLRPSGYGKYFFYYEENEAVDHLFRLTCGLESAILAEDQILTQVGNARAFAHDCRAADGVLEILFQMAVTTAKKVKTNVAFTRANASAVDAAIARLRAQGFEFRGSRCMVIGNGAYGKLAANTLVRTGAEVVVTVRQYHSGRLNVPVGCTGIPYEERLSYLPNCDVVISATASPHYTLTYEELGPLDGKMERTKPIVLIDLAVPPDIDPRISDLPSFTLTNIDDYSTGDIEANRGAWEKAEKILREEEARFRHLLLAKELAPEIQQIEEQAERNMHLRMTPVMREVRLADEEKTKLTDEIDAAAKRTVNRLIFDLQDHLDPETFRKCVKGLEQVYQED